MEFHQSTVTPCPFSPSYRLPRVHAWRSLQIYALYRIALASGLGLLFVTHVGPSLLGRHMPSLFALASGVFVAAAWTQGALAAWQRPGYSVQAQLLVIADIASIAALMHASGGITSGFGMLIAVAIAAGGLLIGGRCALFYAALATLALLGLEVYADLTDAFEQTAYTYAGMLGAAFFTIALLAHVLAQRAEQSEALAAQRGVDLANLQQLNDFIIRHIQRGIIVVGNDAEVRMTNPAAASLLDLPGGTATLKQCSEALYREYLAWQSNLTLDTAMIRRASGEHIQAHFTRIGTRQQPLNMIFLDDADTLGQRLQQVKLASLDRLTASIAHEIRNPLSAIRHASQLLGESPELGPQDRRLTDIVLQHTDRVNRIIENILQISRRTPAEVQRVDLIPWLQRFIRDFCSEHHVAPTALHLLAGPSERIALIDPSHLQQILDNLCGNALKHGNPGQEGVTIDVGRVGEREQPYIEVRDSGPGIAKEHITMIFEPFFTTTSCGTGLGLYIARELAELNHAKLTYLPGINGGSTFRLTLTNPD